MAGLMQRSEGNMPAERRRMEEAGRNGDTRVSHTTEGELVVPRRLLDDPQARGVLQGLFADAGLEFDRYIVGAPEGPTNPQTGAEEFFDDGSGTASEADANDDGTTSAAEAAAAGGDNGGNDGAIDYSNDYGPMDPAAEGRNGFERSLGVDNPLTGNKMTIGDFARFGLGLANPALGIVSTVGGLMNMAGATPSTDRTPGTRGSPDQNGGAYDGSYVYQNGEIMFVPNRRVS